MADCTTTLQADVLCSKVNMGHTWVTWAAFGAQQLRSLFGSALLSVAH